MLVLSRRLHESIVFPSIGAKVQVVAVKAGVVRLGIDAPPEVPVLREELPDRQKEWGKPPAPKTAESTGIAQLLQKRLQVTGIGLSLLRRQIREGRHQDADTTLAKIEEDLQLLQKRFGSEENRPVVKPQPARRARKALLVEDDDNECVLMAAFLRMAGLDVVTASDGCDALDYLRTQARPDVMLLDMMLPRCDGPTTVRHIRNDPALAGLKIYGVTGHSPERFHLPVGSGGVDGWFQKPVDPEILLHDLCSECQPA